MEATTVPCTPPKTPPLPQLEAKIPSFTNSSANSSSSAESKASHQTAIMSGSSPSPANSKATLRQRKQPQDSPPGSTYASPMTILSVPSISRSSTDPQILSDQIGVDVSNKAGQTNSLSHEEKLALLQSPALRQVLTGSLKRATDKETKGKKRHQFRELIFTKKFTVFDGQNESTANSPFIGFFNLFWMSVFLCMIKIVIVNIYRHGNLLGTHEIFTVMISRDLVFLGLADGFMCALMGVSWGIQRAVLAGMLDWDNWGWIIQHIWQTFMLASVIGLTLYREWPWTHTVFFVLHGLTMLMKHHSYSFYNGYLSTIYKDRAILLERLDELNEIEPSTKVSASAPGANEIDTEHLETNPQDLPSDDDLVARREYHDKNAQDHELEAISAAIISGEPLDLERIKTYKRVIQWEIDALTEELKGLASIPENFYPRNLTITNCAEWIVLPTLVYELEYPRSDKINWRYVAVKLTAIFGIIFVMMLISQHSIYPVLSEAAAMKAANVPLRDRFYAWPGMLSDLMFPFMMEYLLTWYLIWETILNLLAELTYFEDRSFYDAWWNTVTWDQYARDWNRPVHNFLLRHVYHSSQASMKINRPTATLLTFLLSACVHELVMWCLFKKLRGYLLMMQMSQVPLVSISRSRWLRGQKTIGNLIFWLGLFTGPSLLCSLYVIL